MSPSWCAVFLPIPQKSNEYRYLKCTAVSISILNVEKYCGQYQYPVKYWSIFQYQYRYLFLKHILLLTFNMYVKDKYFIFILWSDHVWQLDEVESFLPLHKDWLLHLVLMGLFSIQLSKQQQMPCNNHKVYIKKLN